MKASNSRFSHRPAARYSNLAHVQGGMLTDADLTEAGQIHQTRDEALGQMALASGVPGEGGMVALAAGVPSLRAGRVVAGGRTGQFALTGTAATIPQVLAAQADFPQAPALPAGPVLLYADLWDRVVQGHEDPRLTDAGLHGAVTSYRTRTMVQVKALPLTAPLTEAAALALWRAGSVPFLAKGTARASVAPNQAIQNAEDCDPCATSVDLVQVIPNALFRAEILEVTRNATGQPVTVRLAWSMENAETLLGLTPAPDQTARDDFARAGAAYEWLNLATEAHLGIVPGGTAQRPFVTATLTAPAAMTPAPTHVRRWDGSAEVTLATAGAVPVTGGGSLAVAGGDLVLTVDLLRLTIAIGGAQVQAGDHWLVELRRHAAEAERLHLVGVDGGSAPPLGPDHRFCPLFVTTGNTPAVLDDATKRRLSFPALNDLPADHIGFAPECEPLFGNARNVQEALRALCSLNAGHIAYTPPCPDWFGTSVTTVKGALDALCDLPADKITFTPDIGCDRFKDATNVDEALKRLCNIDDSALLRLVLKSMMDWGVVCGLTLAKGDAPFLLSIAAGTALDRDGRIKAVAAEPKLDLNGIEGSDKLASLIDGKGEVCLALRLNDTAAPTFAFVTTAAAQAQVEPTMAEAIQACQQRRPWLWQGDTLKALTAQQAELLRQVNLTWTDRARLDGFTALTATQAAEVDTVVKGLARDYAALFPAEEARIVTRDLKRVDAEITTAGLNGAAADQRRMTKAVAQIAILERNEALSWALCVCRNAHTPCAPDMDGKSFVPLGCVTFEDLRPGQIKVAEICPVCCRKQALTWRSYRFYGQPDFVTRMWTEYKVKDTCCVQREAPPDVDWGDLLDDWIVTGPIFDPPIDFEPVIPRVWPPKGIRIGPEVINTLPDFTRLTGEAAKKIVEGHGVSVVDTLDLSAGGALDKIAVLQGQEAVQLDYSAVPQPGDRVVLLTSGGKTVGSVTIGRGDAPLPFAKGLAAGIDLGGLRVELDQIEAQRVEAAAGMALLQRDRATVMDEVAGLKAEVAALEAQRRTIGSDVLLMREDQTRLVAEIAQARDGLKAEMAEMQAGITGLRTERAAVEAQVTALKAAQETAVLEMGAVRTQLDEMRVEGQAFILDLGGRRRIETLTNTNLVPVEVVTGLTSLGVTTLAEAEALTDAQLRRVVGRGQNLTVTDLRTIIRNERFR